MVLPRFCFYWCCGYSLNFWDGWKGARENEMGEIAVLNNDLLCGALFESTGENRQYYILREEIEFNGYSGITMGRIVAIDEKDTEYEVELRWNHAKEKWVATDIIIRRTCNEGNY